MHDQILCGTRFLFYRTYKPQIDEFIAYVQNMSAKYRTDNVIITMGEDFNYLDANVWFRNLDKLNQ